MAETNSTPMADVSTPTPSWYSTLPPDQLAEQALVLANEIAEKDDRLFSLLYVIRDQLQVTYQETDSASAHSALNLTELLVDLMGDAAESLMLRDMIKSVRDKVAA